MALTFPSWITEAAAWNEDVVYLLDSEMRFVDCNPVWDEFASANGGVGIFRAQIIGKSILDFVPDVLRTFYVQKFWLANRSPGWTELDYHCSSPEKIRLFRMGMMNVAQELLVVNHLLLEEACEVRPPLTETEKEQYRSPEGFRHHVCQLPEDEASGRRHEMGLDSRVPPGSCIPGKSRTLSPLYSPPIRMNGKHPSIRA